MAWHDRIETNPDVLNGKPVVAGTRIAVALVVELLAEDWSTDEILAQYPALSQQDIRACLSVSARVAVVRVHPGNCTDP